jgi:glycosyltransferase involved in cell wall biosynthesis
MTNCVQAPIVLFAYNRCDHLRRTISALSKNFGAISSDLIIFSDAAKADNNECEVEEVREYLATISGFRSVTIHKRDYNFGLAKSILEGVSEILEIHEHVIVLEDDIETSPYFLAYMNDALILFRDSELVASIHGYVYPVNRALPDAFFLRGADCWGWATWRRAWVHFNPYAFSKMLKDQIEGRNDSWAVRWHASVFLKNMLTLYPGKSLVHNIGNDDSGTHCATSNVHDVLLSTERLNLSCIDIRQSEAGYLAFEEFFRSSRGNFRQRLSRYLSAAMRKLTR